MQTPLDLLQAAATSEIDLGGIRFRCRRITSRDLDGYRGYQLLVMGVPDAELRGLAESVAEMIKGGGDPLQAAAELIDGRLRIRAERVLDPAVQQRGEDWRASVLAAGVTHWSVDGVEWRLVRLVHGAVEASQGDGATVPDVCPVRLLPGGGSGEDALCAAVLDLSRMGPQEAERIARFRAGA